MIGSGQFRSPKLRTQAEKHAVERKTTRWCAKCGKWIARSTKRHACDGPPSPKKWRLCGDCGEYVRIKVRHACDRVTSHVPEGTPEKKCRACGESWPLTSEFWHRAGVKWRPECRVCRADRRAALDAGAPRVKPWHGACTVPTYRKAPRLKR